MTALNVSLTASAALLVDLSVNEPPVELNPGGMLTPDGTVVHPFDDLTANELHALYGATPRSSTLLERVSPIMPDPRDVPVAVGRPRASTFKPTAVERETLGWVRVVVDGEDVTFLRGVPVEVRNIREQEPFGWQSAELFFPQITGFEDDRYGHAAKFFDGARVAITLRSLTGTKKEDLFHGVIVERSYEVAEGGAPGLTVGCLGLLYTADLTLAKPELVLEAQDLADVLKQRLNKAPGKRYLALEPTGPCGIDNRDRGAWQPLLTGFVQDALSDAVTDDGQNQWTILMHGRRPVLKLKDRTTVHHKLILGTPGISVSLTRDVTQATTTVYGYGVAGNNEAWANLKLPDYDHVEVAWPFGSGSAVMTVGTTTGATTLQKRLRRAGYGVDVTGTYNSKTASAVKAFQGSNGLDVTGTVNAATWTAIFAASMDPGLDSAYYAPLASIGPVEKWTYNADGAKTGLNANFDDTRVRVERWHAYADGLGKKEAARAARAEVRRDKNPGWVGTITLRVDPEDTSRWSMHAGQNVRLRGFLGDSRVYDNNPDANPDQRDVLLHIVEVSRDGDGTVTLTVDTEAHDLPTLDAITVRDREAVNPGRRPGAKRRSETPPDTPVIDGELKGWIDGLPVAAETWTVIKVPVGDEGTIVGLDLNANVATRFAAAFFCSPVTQANLNSITTTPLQYVDEETGTRPFPGVEATADDLEALGWLDTVGGPGEAAGYWPGSQSDGGAITGKHKDRAVAIPFQSWSAPWVWVAVWSKDAAVFDGKIYLEPRR